MGTGSPQLTGTQVGGGGPHTPIAVQVAVWGKSYSASEIAAQVLTKMKESAEAYLGHDVKDVVVTVPAYFDERMKNYTKIAGDLANLNVIKLIDEPTAAAIRYSMDHRNGEEIIMVVDIGGGTSDISIL